ncbi:MAG: hypothetical protein QNJ46_06655 [Leptolyngbyaceae cyanobacterium MO_188.B28]|nr:hypothetical protein [Leptolyngbyaceae cyanobacterium MO_188.B28]
MEIEQQINQQRVKHVVSSYQLEGNEEAEFGAFLKQLLQKYPSTLIELALVEILVMTWLRIPPIRGVEFLFEVQKKLQEWESQPVISTITPAQFQQITGLDPQPIFGLPQASKIQPISRSLTD